ncbi:PIG-L deacetylase family protein [Jatrophihabitans sp. YIM 134969]
MSTLGGRRRTRPPRGRSRVVVALHAHPDDESLLTGGTLATLSANGHRVVLIVATDGGNGLTGASTGDLGARRTTELAQAASVLGVHRIVRLGYTDSGSTGAEPDGFCQIDVGVVADRVCEVLREEDADLLLGYDREGGYGHPDHRHVHTVAEVAAQRSGTRLLHATVDRTWLDRGMRLAGRFHLLPDGVDPRSALDWYCDPGQITHRVRARRAAPLKRRALRCHASQMQGADTAVRTVQLLSRLPLPLFHLVAGTEWFAEPGALPGRRPLADLFAVAPGPTP